MFESTREVLTLFGQFMAIGFALGALYNVFRLLRLVLRELKALCAALDLLFPVFAGLILFIFSVELGTGFFRLYYVFAAALGFSACALTLGLLTPFIAKAVRRAAGIPIKYIKKLFMFIKQKLFKLFGIIYKFLSKIARKGKISLQNKAQMLYNKKVTDIKENSAVKGGENRYVIKARVRKNT